MQDEPSSDTTVLKPAAFPHAKGYSPANLAPGRITTPAAELNHVAGRIRVGHTTAPLAVTNIGGATWLRGFPFGWG